MELSKIQETYSKFATPEVGQDPLVYYKRLTENLKLLHSTISSSFDNFDDMLTTYLAVGTKIFGLESGIVSRILGSEYHVVAVKSPMPIEPGAIFQLEETYCRDVYQSQKTIAFPNVGEDKILCQHPCYINTSLESYISAPIIVDGEIYGTINFSSMTNRERMFNTDQRDIIDLMAKNVGDFITKMNALKALAEKTNQLSKANQKINFFIGTVAHDLRNPLGAIDSYIELLEESEDMDEVKSHLPNLTKCADQSLKMVNDLLPLMSMKSGTFTIQKSRFEIRKLFEEDILLFQSRLGEKDLKIDLDIPEDLTVLADPDKISHAFQNLISNAIKFSNPGGAITVKESHDNQEKIGISVTDNGVGIPKDKIPLLFDETSSVSTTGTKGEVGTGLGLPYVAEILKAHGSDIVVESEEGKGATFSFKLAA